MKNIDFNQIMNLLGFLVLLAFIAGFLLNFDEYRRWTGELPAVVEQKK